MELGLLLLRLVVAAILVVHATQKGLGWFDGPGWDKAVAGFEGLGARPGRLMVGVAVAIESLSAVLLAAGLATPLGAAMVAGTMLVAGLLVTLSAGKPWHTHGGGEYPLLLSAVGVTIAFTGPGAWSLDRLLSAPWYDTSKGTTISIGITSAVIACLLAVPVVLQARSARPSTNLH